MYYTWPFGPVCRLLRPKLFLLSLCKKHKFKSGMSGFTGGRKTEGNGFVQTGKMIPIAEKQIVNS
jgi:hypothetical protein